LKKKFPFFYLLLAVLFFAFSTFLEHKSSWMRNSELQERENFQKKIWQKERRLLDIVNDLSQKAENNNYLQLLNENIDYYHNLLKTEGFALLIYENDSLQFWSDNSIPVENYFKQICLDQPVEKLNNGWFRILKKTKGYKTTLGLMLIKKEYPIHNQYLEDEFQSDFALAPESQLLYGAPQDKAAILSSDGSYLFTLNVKQNSEGGMRLAWIITINMLGVLFLGLFLSFITKSTSQHLNGNWAFLILIFVFLILRLIGVYFLFPTAFYQLDLFSPAIYANSIYIASLGDLFLHCLFLFFGARIFYKRVNLNRIIRLFPKIATAILPITLFSILFFLGWHIIQLNISIIQDSKIPFNIENLLSLNVYSYVAFCSIGLLLLAFFLVSDKVISSLLDLNIPYKLTLISLVASLSLYLYYAHYHGGRDMLITLWFIPVIAFVFYTRKKAKADYNFAQIIVFLLLFSASIDYVFYKELGKKEHDTRRLFAENLAEEKDPVAEFLFTDIEKKIARDSLMPRQFMFPENDYSDFVKSFTENYFTGYWDKYELKFIVYDSLCNVLVKSNNSVNDKLEHYENVVKSSGLPTNSKSLFYVPVNQDENTGLLAKIKFQVPQIRFANPATLYIELLPKFITEEIGYPQLLLDKAVVPRHDEEFYSFAKYKDRAFVPLQRVGKYKYPLNSAVFDSLIVKSSFVELNGFNHLLYRFNSRNSDLIVVSKEPQQLLNRLTVFSYLFTLFSLMILLYFILFHWQFHLLDLGNKFRNRIQFVLVAVVLTAILLIGGGTILFLKKEYKSKNLTSISEKIHSLNVELSHEIGDERSLNYTSNQYLNYVLAKQSNVFYSDINLYDLSGNLIASSRPQIFEQGLISQKMDPIAFNQLKVHKQFEYTHNEKIGKLDFLSCYMPFIGNNNQLLGYLNLPYFNKQNELEKEISSVLVALINVYVLLFVLSIVLAIFISNRIMEPLKLLQNKISHIRLGKSNELIEWNNKDEIGELITEYNRMILELSDSAERLAKSERESAWREMAKQVAHEIKNPLTPMKLSVQHLERAYNDGVKDWPNRLQKFTKTLIEQIDTLSNIANEFSNFAKMPTTHLQEVNPAQVLNSVVSLYQNNEAFNIEIELNKCENCLLRADKQQLIRLFNNLIKNAIQAIPDGRIGVLRIKFGVDEGELKIDFCDNGTGIEENKRDRIFTPNFTTKTGGMGLGLAMSKSIVENFGGSITFTSIENEGSIFTVTFPLV
jgi:two-component system nitrogen regulation sensor histidine kinase NtrY